MENSSLRIKYRIYLEAEDINQSRIFSTTTFAKNLFTNCRNVYFHNVNLENENDPDDFILRLYFEKVIEEAECSSHEDAENFISDMAHFLNIMAQAQSYLDMEGDFSIEYEEQKEFYHFTSERGQVFCDFQENR